MRSFIGNRKRHPAELKERALRMLREVEVEHASPWAAIRSVVVKVGCSPESLRKWQRQAEIDAGERAGVPSAEKERIRELERENRELREANVPPLEYEQNYYRDQGAVVAA